MDGIVTGKVEKPSGSFIWKTYATADLSQSVKSVTIDLRFLGLGTNAYIKIETATHKVMIINIPLLGYSRYTSDFSEGSPDNMDLSVEKSPRSSFTATDVTVSTWTVSLNNLLLSVEVGTFE